MPTLGRVQVAFKWDPLNESETESFKQSIQKQLTTVKSSTVLIFFLTSSLLHIN